MAQVPLGPLTWVFLRTGNLTFGGGDPTTLALLQELVIARTWLSREQYALVFALARVTPGTNLLAFCAGAGWLLGRWWGTLAAILAVSAPGAVIVVLLTAAFESARQTPLAMAAIGGILASAVGMMLGGAINMLRPGWQTSRLRACLLPAAAFAAAWSLGLSPLVVIALGAAAGALWRGTADQ
ncbi:MAG: chromate transporter [Bryobacterales bacterium]|nr:chromate transporter [Bryobacterales bacterium]